MWLWAAWAPEGQQAGTTVVVRRHCPIPSSCAQPDSRGARHHEADDDLRGDAEELTHRLAVEPSDLFADLAETGALLVVVERDMRGPLAVESQVGAGRQEQLRLLV